MNTLFFQGTLVPLCLIVPFLTTVSAAPFTWDGGAKSNKDSWTDGDNWASNSGPANNGTADLTFTGNARTSHDLGQDWDIKSLTFSDKAGNFTIGGSQTLTIQNGVTNNDPGTQTLNVKIALGADQTWTSTDGTLVVGSEGDDRTLSNNGRTLTLDGAGTFLFNAQFTGSGGLVKNGSGTAILSFGSNSALSTYTGTTTVNAGLLVTDLGSSSGAPLTPLTGTITIGGGSQSATLETRWLNQIGDTTRVNVLGNGTLKVNASSWNGQFPGGGHLQETIGNLNVSGGSLVQTVSGSTSEGSLNVSGGITHDGLGNSPATIAGNLSLNGSTQTIAVAEGGGDSSLVISAAVSNGGILKTGDGTLVLQGTNTYTGTTTLTGGTTFINGNQSAATGALTVGEGATLSGTGTIGGATTIYGTHAPGGSSGVGTQTFNGDLTYATGSIFSWDISSTGFDQVAGSGQVYFESGVVFQIVVGEDIDIETAWWPANQSWSSIFSGFTIGSQLPTAVEIVDTAGNTVALPGSGHFNITGSGITWSAAPEPSGLLSGLVLASALLRRRRN